MSSPAPSMPPPPPSAGGMQGPPSSGSQTQAATAPSEMSPKLEQASQLIIGIVQRLRAWQQIFPQVTPFVNQINDLMRQGGLAMMQNAQPTTPAAPPTNG